VQYKYNIDVIVNIMNVINIINDIINIITITNGFCTKFIRYCRSSEPATAAEEQSELWMFLIPKAK
jgi:hypothetical protein